MTSSLGSIHLLGGSQNSERFYLLQPLFVRKGCNLGIAIWKGGIGQGKEKEPELQSSLDIPFSPKSHVFTVPETLRTSSFWVFMQASLQKHG